MSDKRNCPFCEPVQRILKSNASAYVLLSNPRKIPGHFLVIPKRHVEKPWELTKEELADIFELIFFVEGKIIGKLGEGCDIRQHYRPFQKQGWIKVDHVHFHVIPRNWKDEIYQNVEKHDTEMFQDMPPDEHDSVAAILES